MPKKDKKHKTQEQKKPEDLYGMESSSRSEDSSSYSTEGSSSDSSDSYESDTDSKNSNEEIQIDIEALINGIDQIESHYIGANGEVNEKKLNKYLAFESDDDNNFPAGNNASSTSDEAFLVMREKEKFITGKETKTDSKKISETKTEEKKGLYELFKQAEVFLDSAEESDSDYYKIYNFHREIKRKIAPSNFSYTLYLNLDEAEFIEKLNDFYIKLTKEFEEAEESLDKLLKDYAENKRNSFSLNKKLKLDAIKNLKNGKLSLDDITALKEGDLGKKIKDWIFDPDHDHAQHAEEILPRSVYDRLTLTVEKRDEKWINLLEEAAALKEELKLKFPTHDSETEFAKSLLDIVSKVRNGEITDINVYGSLLIETHKAATLHNNPVKDVLAICLQRLNINPVTPSLSLRKFIVENLNESEIDAAVDAERNEKLYGKISTPIETLTRTMAAKFFNYAMQKGNDEDYKNEVKEALALAQDLLLCDSNEKLLNVAARAAKFHRQVKKENSSASVLSLLKELTSKVNKRCAIGLTQKEAKPFFDMKLEQSFEKLQDFLDDKKFSRMFKDASYEKMIKEAGVLMSQFSSSSNTNEENLLINLKKKIDEIKTQHSDEKTRLHSILNEIENLIKDKQELNQQLSNTSVMSNTENNLETEKIRVHEEELAIPKAKVIHDEITKDFEELNKFVTHNDDAQYLGLKDSQSNVGDHLARIKPLIIELQTSYKEKDTRKFVSCVGKIHAEVNQIDKIFENYIENLRAHNQETNPIDEYQKNKAKPKGSIDIYDVEFLKSPSEKLYRHVQIKLANSKNTKHMPELLKTLEIINESKRLDDHTRYTDMVIAIQNAYRKHKNEYSHGIHNFIHGKSNFENALENILKRILGKKEEKEKRAEAKASVGLFAGKAEEKTLGQTQSTSLKRRSDKK